MQDIADEIARLLDASVTIEDRSFNLLAYGAQSGTIDTVRQESILRRRATDEVRAYFEAYGIATAAGPVRIPGLPGMLGRVCVPLRHGGVNYGYLWVLDAGPADSRSADAGPTDAGSPGAGPGDSGSVDSGSAGSKGLTDERLAAVAPLVARAAARLAREARGRHARLRDFFSADPGIRAAAGVTAEAPVAAIAVRTSPDRAGAPWTLPRGVLTDPSPDEPLVAVLAPAPQAAEVAGRLHDLYGRAAGIGGPRDDPEEAWESWREALVALRVAEHVERHAPVASWPELGVYRLLAKLSPRDLAELAAESAPLSIAGGELAGTVEAYLDHAGHAQETATRLGVHRQTLYYRLGKAEHLTGLDLADGGDRLLLHLSLKAATLTGEPGRSAPSRRTS
ncbi:helix-turn-helix domain-containing protein [Planotetraspora sp. A-T 1434]|uniref:PucR family transcriptional regulator n=1 Tax=Planotetraspora sp. A-T 1434 TaxID=2979219 RepID=UPI0021C0117B|nr:helix-turn-helix domain-containing protein [Planotetraspora sp. A-T 1434]MCT9930456.1 helix-turn-helix domain-containing protein [Planotetraspora sp. A-T 1434]